MVSRARSETDSDNSILGAVNALFAFGAACGAILQGWTADWLGRKGALAIAASCALIGGALTAGSTAIAMLITVRIIQGCGLGMLICLVPLYITEVAPAHRRGLLSGMTTIAFGTGYCVYVTFSFQELSDNVDASKLTRVIVAHGFL